MGLGKVAGRLALVGPRSTGRRPALIAACNLAQVAALVVPFITIATPALAAAAVLVGAASGATTVLRPLLVVDLVGTGGFATANARLQRAASLSKAAGPAAVGIGATTVGWPLTWAVTLGLFVAAADRYRRVGRDGLLTSRSRYGRNCRPAGVGGRLPRCPTTPTPEAHR